MAFSGAGAGTIGDPYVITTAVQLQEIADDVTAFYVLGNDISSIGTFSKIVGFSGSFNGNGYELEGITVSGGSSTSGIFGDTIGATVENFNVRNSSNSSGLYTGLVVGWAKSSSIIRNIGIIDCTIVGSANQLGGIVGFCQSGSVTNCYNDNSSVTGGNVTSRVGGIIGRGGSAVRCYNTGLVSTSNATYKGDAIISEGTSTNCFWDSETSGTTLGNGTSRTTAQMKDIETYSSVWDIVTEGSYVDQEWFIDDGVDYPRLGFEYVEPAGGEFLISGEIYVPQITSTGVLSNTNPVYNVSGNISIPAITTTGSITNVTPTYSVSGAISIPALTSSAELTNNNPVYAITGNFDIPSLTSTGVVENIVPIYSISAGASIPQVTTSCTLTFIAPVYSITGAFSIPSITTASTIENIVPIYSISGAVDIPQITSEGLLLFGEPQYVVTGEIYIPKLTSIGNLNNTVPGYSILGAVYISQITSEAILIFGEPQYVISGDISILKLTSIGNINNTVPAYSISGEVEMSQITSDASLIFGYPEYVVLGNVFIPHFISEGVLNITVPLYNINADIILPEIISIGQVRTNLVASSIQVILDGVWRDSTEVFVLVSGDWKPASEIKVLHEGTWRSL